MPYQYKDRLFGKESERAVIKQKILCDDVDFECSTRVLMFHIGTCHVLSGVTPACGKAILEVACEKLFEDPKVGNRSDIEISFDGDRYKELGCWSIAMCSALARLCEIMRGSGS